MIKIYFEKDIEVDYWIASYNSTDSRMYRRGNTITIMEVEKVGRNHVNFHFDNGDIAISVPVNSFIVES